MRAETEAVQAAVTVLMDSDGQDVAQAIDILHGHNQALVTMNLLQFLHGALELAANISGHAPELVTSSASDLWSEMCLANYDRL